MAAKKTRRICPKGHRYYKSSDCPSCPECEKAKKPASGFLAAISAPARRAMERDGISTLKQLAKHTEQEIAALHGVGDKVIRTMKALLAEEELQFKQPRVK